MPMRRLAWGLVAYGLLGLILVIGGLIAGLPAVDRIERLAGAADGAVTAAVRSTRAAANSFDSIDESLSSAHESVDEASGLARNASATLRALSDAMRLSVFGAQPLLPLADDFSTSADQAAALAGTLDDAGSSLGDTRVDVAAIGVELDTLSDDLESVAGSTAGDAPPLRLLLVIVLTWVAIPALGAIVFGTMLLRGGRLLSPPS